MIYKENLELALENVGRYEQYKLIRAWGIVSIIVGLTRFFLAFIIEILLVWFVIRDIFNFSRSGAILLGFLKSFIQILTLILLAIIFFYSYISVKKTIFTENQIISQRMINLGLALIILYLFVFVFKIPGSTYRIDFIGVIICYFLLNRRPENDFKELLYQGITLFLILVFNFVWQFIYILTFFDFNIDMPRSSNDLAIPVFMLSYFVINFVIAAIYVGTGYMLIKKASRVLEGENDSSRV